MEQPGQDGADTRGAAYTERLVALQTVWWKRVLPVQAPYRWNVRRLRLGRVLDVGCGLGRNLTHLDGNGVGVDHNPAFVAHCRSLGLRAWTTEEFAGSPDAVRGGFDSLLLAHVVEHVDAATADEILRTYLPYVRPGGAVHVVTPQERGQAFDPTHVRFCDFDVVEALLRDHGLAVERRYSFPFPRWAGSLFVYNEFNVTGRLAGP
ncbi:class I SAM-dependent methyltransferase [Aquipuribacter sp. SD81]|uniref:class I SAM-dependent methyltransferase n=1 Tax=Aquipuribacter sp. SD81 TaxID=3127703 RepID=UPI0030198932